MIQHNALESSSHAKEGFVVSESPVGSVFYTNLLSGAGRFLLGREEAEAVFGRIADTVRDRWRAEMRGAGASGRDCREIAPAFLHDGLFCENVG